MPPFFTHTRARRTHARTHARIRTYATTHTCFNSAQECPTICFRGADPSVHLAARVERVKAHHCKKDPWKGKYPLVLMPDSWGGQLGEYKLFDLTGGIFNLLPEFLLNQIVNLARNNLISSRRPLHYFFPYPLHTGTQL